jgi:hypothetical protein
MTVVTVSLIAAVVLLIGLVIWSMRPPTGHLRRMWRGQPDAHQDDWATESENGLV